MATIVTRLGKGSALTFTEVDNNFSNLNTDKLESVSEDTTPALGGNLNVNGNSIVSASNGNIPITANGTGIIQLGSPVTVNQFNSHKEKIYAHPSTSGTLSIDPANGPIQYLTLDGNITINGFANGATGHTVSLIIDGSEGSYTITLGADILKPGGTLALTDGGADLLTITLIDDETPVYIATIVNDFQ